MNPYVFIVGCPRSGTTLLQRMVDAHGQIAILRAETHWIPKLFERRIGVDSRGFATPELVPTVMRQRTFPKLELDEANVRRILDASDGTYSNAVSGIFDACGQRCGKALVGDKTPGYVRKIETLHRLWPRARFVHLVRDGRDVCLSVLEWERKHRDFAQRYRGWSSDRVTTAALWWAWHVSSGRAAVDQLRDDLYMELRYEELVTDPEAACRRVCAFLGLPYDERMLRFHEGRTRSKAGLSAKRAWLPVLSGLRDWRAHMSADDAERFEAAAGSLLDELGYERRTSCLSRAALEQAERLDRMFSDDVAALDEAVA